MPDETTDVETTETTSSPSETTETVTDTPLGVRTNPPLNDTAADDEAVLGHFVDVVSGEHEGRYGVFIENFEDNAVVRTRDNESERIVTKISDLRPAQAGRR